MPKQVVSVREGEPLLDIVSLGRRGPRDNGGRLTPDQLEQIRRIVHRAPEVMVKVLSRASNDLKAVGRHVDYIRRSGILELETDDGARLENRSGKALLEEWDLDIDEVRHQAELTSTTRTEPPKLVHKLMFSMPPGTAPDKVLAAVRNFAREEFWGHHRYAFVLHTDEDHPHVHLVLKAVSEQGVRLNIRKVTLRHWRSEFARHLRFLDVAANATERAVRGQNRKASKDGIYRANLRGDSTHIRTQMELVASSVLNGRHQADEGASLRRTRFDVERGWRATSEKLRDDGHMSLALQVTRFLSQMPSPRTEQEQLADELRLRARGEPNNARSDASLQR